MMRTASPSVRPRIAAHFVPPTSKPSRQDFIVMFFIKLEVTVDITKPVFMELNRHFVPMRMALAPSRIPTCRPPQYLRAG